MLVEDILSLLVYEQKSKRSMNADEKMCRNQVTDSDEGVDVRRAVTVPV